LLAVLSFSDVTYLLKIEDDMSRNWSQIKRVKVLNN
jgi:hypothetical protein